MKTITSSILVVVAVIASNVTALWAVVGFILYLVKDDPFNWWSVWGFIISVIVAIVGALYASVSEAKKQREALAEFSKNRSGGKQSRFAQRLEEMIAKAATE